MTPRIAFALVLGFSAAAWAEGDGGKAAPPAAPDAKKAASDSKAPDPKKDVKKDAPDPKKDAPDGAKDAPDAKRDAPEPVAPVHGARYKITLKTGRSFSGVVISDYVFERHDGTNWSKSEKDVQGAGVRLYFLRDQEGFVFVTMREIKTAEKLGDVTEKEGVELAQQRNLADRRASDERDRLRKERSAKEEAAKAKAAEEADKAKADAGKGAAGGSSTEDEVARYTALLAKFPPGRFTPDTPKDIEHRRIVMDLFPSDEEKEFLAVFDEWSKAYSAWKAGQDKPKAAAPTAEK